MWAVVALSAAFTYLFFLEYLPPFKRVHIPYDLPGYYYPLADYAFQSLRDGRLPQWDAGIYCGIPFAGNTAAALFYPPAWLAFAANAGRRVLAYGSIEILVFAHVWLAFFLCFVWLRRKGLADFASAAGAGVFAFSGYLCQHLQHFEVTSGYVWMPLGLWGIDEAAGRRHWRPLWKVAVASALCFLAGYPPLWFVLAVSMVAYAAALRFTLTLRVIAAIGASLALAAIQLLPAMEAVAMRSAEIKYGGGRRDPSYLVAYLLPNHPDFRMQAAGRPDDQYLYLGAAALLGLLWVLRARDRRAWAPAVVAGVAIVFATNPFGAVWAVVRHSSLLAQVCRDWYFLAAITLAAAPLAAIGIDHALRRPRQPKPAWVALAASGALLAWTVRQVMAWLQGGLATGWTSGLEMAVALALCAAAIYLLPTQKGLPRAVLAAALLVAAGAEYKVFGTSSRVNAAPGEPAWNGRAEPLPAMEEAVYWRLREHRQYRVAVDLTAPWPQQLRHHALSTPQGLDSFLPAQYRKVVEETARFRNEREIELGPGAEEALRLFGVRYFITSPYGPHYAELSAHPAWRPVGPATGYYRVFEYLHARPPYGWDTTQGDASLSLHTPEMRRFMVRSETGGRFVLAEQHFPGWRASVDGSPVKVERWRGAFQSVQVPAGEHNVEFRYRSPGLIPGAAISLATLLLGSAVLFIRR